MSVSDGSYLWETTGATTFWEMLHCRESTMEDGQKHSWHLSLHLFFSSDDLFPHAKQMHSPQHSIVIEKLDISVKFHYRQAAWESA